MTLHAALRTLGWLAGTLFPQQALRVLQGRDFNAALGRVDDALATEPEYRLDWTEMLNATEESAEVLPPRFTLYGAPGDFPLCNCPARQAADLDDHRPACAARAADSPAADERIPDQRPAAGRTRDAGVFDRDAYMAGLKWPEPTPRLDRDDQVDHVSAIVRSVGVHPIEALTAARRIVDMLAADKRIAERLDGAK